ncbi:hypothetical protein A0H81_02510 [Grifola frondosa]|uniref:RING-type domain-containing protein n=1 Tax=Grifola frondosa TaxID=5627 RepID=A0A1C7MJX1_GRIFR|nr:hypothetical protein A0H81_02510 [Grifola frondosa]
MGADPDTRTECSVGAELFNRDMITTSVACCEFRNLLCKILMSKKRSKQHVSIASTDVIEISSSDDDCPPTSTSRLDSARKRLSESEKEVRRLRKSLEDACHIQAQLRAELCQHTQELKEARMEAETLRRSVEDADRLQAQLCVNSERQTEFISTIKDHLLCTICMTEMWSPYVLVCGHTFCQECLEKWFDGTFVQHLETHNNYIPNDPVLANYQAALENLHMPDEMHRQLHAEAMAIIGQQPQPQYTCPSCRVLVKNRPIEVFSLKSLVRTVAGQLRESSPVRGVRGGVTGRVGDGPWDGFFPFGWI